MRPDKKLALLLLIKELGLNLTLEVTVVRILVKTECVIEKGCKVFK